MAQKKKRKKKKKKKKKRFSAVIEILEDRVFSVEEEPEKREKEEEEEEIFKAEQYDSYSDIPFSFVHENEALKNAGGESWDNDSVSSASTGVNKSLDHDLFCIEVAAIVDTVLAVGTASVLGRKHKVSEQMCLAVALQMQKQTKIGLLRALREQYIEDNISQVFQSIQVEALVDTAIAVGTASVLGRLNGRGDGDTVSEEMVVNAAIQMENQVKNGLIKMKEKYILDNVRHVFRNVPSSIASTGRR